MSEVDRHQLLVTLVHGTWPHGFFPSLQRRNRGPLWFEEGSPFLAQLGAELAGIPYKIKSLPWTGENSIFVRDNAARILADHLSAEHAEHPQASQLVIAHSHGGNIALRAFQHLQTRNGSQREADGISPFVVTLATPFIEIHEADFGPRPARIRFALVIVLWILSILLAAGLILLSFLFLLPELPEASFLVTYVFVAVVVTAATAFLGRWWIVWKAATRRNQINELKDATRLSGLMLAKRLLGRVLIRLLGRLMSAQPPTAAEERTLPEVAEGPCVDSCTAANCIFIRSPVPTSLMATSLALLLNLTRRSPRGRGSSYGMD